MSRSARRSGGRLTTLNAYIAGFDGNNESEHLIFTGFLDKSVFVWRGKSSTSGRNESGSRHTMGMKPRAYVPMMYKRCTTEVHRKDFRGDCVEAECRRPGFYEYRAVLGCKRCGVLVVVHQPIETSYMFVKGQLCGKCRKAVNRAYYPYRDEQLSRTRDYGRKRITPRQWQQLAESYEWRCAYCGNRADELVKDHVIPVSRGGLDDADNIVPACRSCNNKKGTMTGFQFTGDLTFKRWSPSSRRWK